MRAKEYIEASLQVFRNGMSIDDVLANLKRVLHNRGLEKLYSRILKGLLEKLERDTASHAPTVTVARENDLKRHGDEIQSALQKIGASDTYASHIDETIIGGFIATANGKRVDSSYKNTLLHTYHKLVD